MSKKKRSKGPLVIIILVILLAALLGGMKLGLIPGGEMIGLTPENDNNVPESADSREQDQVGEPKAYTIKVQETEVSLDGEVITIPDLETKMDMFRPEDEITLIDAQAIKATYESVLKALEERDLTYNTREE